MTQKRALLLIMVLVVAVLAPAMAQDSEVIAEGLLNPRNMVFDADGNLYVAEAGIGGEQLTSSDTPFGATSQISMITPDGTVEAIVTGLTSYRAGNPLGASDVAVTEDSIWVLLNETGDMSIPFSTGLIELDRETMRVLTWVDLLTPELELDPDGNPNGESNAVDMEVLEDGSVLIANAGCNCLMTWSPETGVEIGAVWSAADDNPVPTAIDIGPDGDVYVGFLSGFPWPESGARVERWSGGELVETFEGLTAVTGLLVTEDGTIYASQFGLFDQGWTPESGSVVEVSADGITPVLEGLTNPFGLAQAPDGTIVVATNTLGGPDGMIVTVPVE